MEEMLADMQSHMQFLEAQYRGRQEDVISLQVIQDFLFILALPHVFGLQV